MANKKSHNRKTHEQYVKEVSEINTNIEVIGTYIKNSVKILHKCLVCGNEWMAIPSKILQGRGCPECGKRTISKKLSKTHEQYVKEVAEKNPNVEVMGKYSNSETKILHRCLICGNEWEAYPCHIIRGHGCPKCNHKGNKKAHEQYIKEVSKINPDIEVVGKYSGAWTKILHKCKTCGHEWNVVPITILRGHGCPKCANVKSSNKKRKTHEEYVAEVSKIHPNIEVVGTYTLSQNKIKHRCLVCGNEWYMTPNCILRGQGCPKCGILRSSKKLAKTHEEYVAEVKDIHPNIEVLGTYVNRNTSILHRCKKCGYEWRTSPASMLANKGCPYCDGRLRSHEQYVKEVAEINPHIEVVGKYIDSHTKILHRCKEDGYEWSAEPWNILHNQGCPKCSMSHGEREVERYLIKHNISYIPQYKFDDCRNQLPLPFDFYLPDYNVCIEYDGQQHFMPVDAFGGEEYLQYVIQNDKIKTKYCEDNDIMLLRIRYDDDVERVLDDFSMQVKQA